MPQVNGTYVEATVEQTKGGIDVVNVFHFQFDDAGGVLSLAQATTINGWIVDFYTALEGFYSTAWALNRINIKDWNADTNPSYEFLPTTVVGTNANQQLAPNLAMVLTKRTIFSGKSFRGRLYLGPFTEADNTLDGRISSELRDAAEAAGQVLIDDSSGTFEWSVVSQFTAGAERPSAVVSPITSALANDEWDHQDRRKN